MNLTVTTPERQLLNETNVEKVVINTIMGEITILPNHMSLVSSIGVGEMLFFKNPEDAESLFVSGGILQFYNNNITILANVAERAREINEADLEESIRRAKKAVEEAELNVNMADIQAKLANDLARLKLASKYNQKKSNPLP